MGFQVRQVGFTVTMLTKAAVKADTKRRTLLTADSLHAIM
jgi:hypothetical protein